MLGDRQFDEPGTQPPISLGRLQAGVLSEEEKADRTAAATAFKAKIIVAESELAAVLHRWMKRRVAAAANRVKSEKSRRHTRHWNPPGDRELKADPALGDEARWRTELETDVDGFLSGMTTRFGNSAGEAIAAAVGVVLGPDNPAFNAAHARVADALRRRTVRIANWSDEVAAQIRDTVAEGESAGLSISAISQTLLDLVDGEGQAWAERIARTEVTGAANEAALQAADQSGVVTQKQWLATPDERTRPSHAEADGQIVDLDDVFEVGDSLLDHPGDPGADPGEVVNCRCTMLLLIENPDGTTDEVDPGDSGGGEEG